METIKTTPVPVTNAWRLEVERPNGPQAALELSTGFWMLEADGVVTPYNVTPASVASMVSRGYWSALSREEIDALVIAPLAVQRLNRAEAIKADRLRAIAATNFTRWNWQQLERVGAIIAEVELHRCPPG